MIGVFATALRRLVGVPIIARENKQPTDSEQDVREILIFLAKQPRGRSTQTIIARYLDIPISTVGRLLRTNPQFVRVAQQGKEVFYAANDAMTVLEISNVPLDVFKAFHDEVAKRRITPSEYLTLLLSK